MGYNTDFKEPTFPCDHPKLKVYAVKMYLENRIEGLNL